MWRFQLKFPQRQKQKFFQRQVGSVISHSSLSDNRLTVERLTVERLTVERLTVERLTVEVGMNYSVVNSLKEFSGKNFFQ